MLRLFPQIDNEPPRNGLPRAISGHTIFEASTQNRTPTSLHAIGWYLVGTESKCATFV